MTSAQSKTNSTKKNNPNELFKKGKEFVMHDIWTSKADELSPKYKHPLKYLKVLVLTLRRFGENKTQVKASALTYYTMMSIVPVLAMIFGIAKGFGLEKFVEEQIISNFAGQEQIMNTLIDFSHNLLHNTGGGIMAGIGIVMLFWAVIKVLTNIEKALNDIWQVEKQRTYVRKFTDYLSVILVVPILLIVSSSITIYVTSQVTDMAKSNELMSMASPVILLMLKMLRLILVWLVFSFVYIAMPNTKVSFVSGIVAGILAGTAFIVLQWGYVYLQIGVTKYNTIYGSFAAIPLFLIWLRYSWLIVLFGAEVAFAYQNIDMYEFESESENISHHNRKVLMLLILNHIIKRFKDGEKPLCSVDISKELHIPQRLLRNILSTMVGCNLLSEVITKDNKGVAYQPAIDINKLTIAYVEHKLDNHGATIDPPVEHLKKIRTMYSSFVNDYRKSTQDTLLGDI